MRTSELVTSYLMAILFVVLAARVISGWLRGRDPRSGHLALATGLFGASTLISAISATIWDTTQGEVAPRWIGIVSSLAIFLAMFAFLLFLSDFIHFHAAFKGLVVVATAFNIVMAVIEQPGIAVRGGHLVVLKVHNPIPYRGYLWYVIIYLTVILAVLGFSFLVYGLRVHGLARARMLTIAAGFLLLFVAIGLIPLLLFGNPSAKLVNNLSSVVRYLGLISAPLLFFGFNPPKRLAQRFAEPKSLAAQPR